MGSLSRDTHVYCLRCLIQQSSLPRPPGCVQAELERILEENHKQLELAKARTVEGAAAEGTAAGKMQSLVSATPANRAGHLADDVYVLGSALSAPKN
jgi:hypothetical protein